jgi:ABC-type bacteriocin/lantibiotic exporter with double-glycine peptidase domain
MPFKQNEIRNRTPLSLIFDVIKIESRNIKYLYIYAIFSGVISLALPLGIQTIIGYVMAGRLNTSWFFLSVLITMAVLLSGLTRMAQISITESIQRKLFLHFSIKFRDRILELKEKGVKMTEQWETRTTYFLDIVTLQKSLSKLLVDFTSKLLQAVFGLLLLAVYHPLFIAFGFIMVFVIYWVLRLTWKRGFDTARYESNFKFKAALSLRNLWLNKNEDELPMLDFRLNEYSEGRTIHFGVVYRQAWLGVITKVVFTAFLLVIGSYLLVEQSISLGQFLAAEILIITLLDAVEKLILTVENLYDCGISMEKLNVIQAESDDQ